LIDLLHITNMTTCFYFICCT